MAPFGGPKDPEKFAWANANFWGVREAGFGRPGAFKKDPSGSTMHPKRFQGGSAMSRFAYSAAGFLQRGSLWAKNNIKLA